MMAMTMSNEGEASRDIPFELVGKIARAGAVAEAGDVEGGSTARHGGEGHKQCCRRA